MPDSELKSILPLKNYYAQLDFGISAAKSRIPAALFPESIDLGDFSAVSLLPEQLEQIPPHIRRKLKERFPAIHAGALFERSMTDQIFCSGKVIREEFALACRELISSLSEQGIHSAVLDLSPGLLMKDSFSYENFRIFLGKIQYTLLKEEFFLLLPYRLPSRNEVTAEQFSLFLQKLMTANIRVLFEIYPHELPPDFSPESLAGTLRLAAGEVCFCYNADCGNRLVRAHLLKFLKYFALTGFKGPFLAAPFSRNPAQFAVEAQAFAALIREFHPQQNKLKTKGVLK